MKYLSVCSGIEAATVAWHPLGWEPAAFSEIEPFPSAVLAHHYPEVPNLGDMTKFKEWNFDSRIDLLVGGTPCQSFSVAGLRKGLADPRGNLMLTYLAIADKFRPRWLVWENVPGVLSSNQGKDFGTFLGGLGELGYGFAYRVLDAQYFGIAQQRRRVFVIGHSGGWQYPAAVLFERSCLSGVSQKARQNNVPDEQWWAGKGRILNCIDASYGSKWGSNQWYARGHVIVDDHGRPRRATILEVERLFGFPDDYTDITKESPFSGRKAPVEFGDAIWNNASGIRDHAQEAERLLRSVWRIDGAACGGSLPSNEEGSGDSLPSVQHQAPDGGGHGMGNAGVGLPGGRRVADGPRYKALGNSMAVPVMAWIGQRIQMVDALPQSIEVAA